MGRGRLGISQHDMRDQTQKEKRVLARKEISRLAFEVLYPLSKLVQENSTSHIACFLVQSQKKRKKIGLPHGRNSRIAFLCISNPLKANECTIPAPRKHSSRSASLALVCHVYHRNAEVLVPAFVKFVENGAVFDVIFIVGLDFSSDTIQSALQGILGRGIGHFGLYEC